MKRISRIIIAILTIVFYSVPVMAAGYSILVLPDSIIDNRIKHTVSSVDIEELLARKFIDKLEYTGRDYAPTLRVLKISIKNNSDYKAIPENHLDNAKILSKSYGVPRVLVVSSKIEQKNNRKQFNTKSDLPILTNQNSNVMVVTKLTMYNSKTNEVVWSDVYYKNIDPSVNTDVNVINSYYDELIVKVLTSMKEAKETHAVMLSSNQKKAVENELKKGKALLNDNKTVLNKPTTKQTNIKKADDKKDSQKVENSIVKTQKAEQENISKNAVKNYNVKSLTSNTPVPNLRMEGENEKPRNVVQSKDNTKCLAKFKESVQSRYSNFVQDRELARIEKLNKVPQQKAQLNIKKPELNEKANKDEPEKVSEKEIADKKIVKKEKVKEEKIKEDKISDKNIVPKKSLIQKLKDKIESAKLAKQEKENAKKEQIRKAKQAEQEKMQENTTKQAEQDNNQTETAPNKLKSKFDLLKANYKKHKEDKIKATEENIKYSNVIIKDNENSSSAHRNIQIRPRYNSINYTPKYDNSVNDI